MTAPSHPRPPRRGDYGPPDSGEAQVFGSPFEGVVTSGSAERLFALVIDLLLTAAAGAWAVFVLRDYIVQRTKDETPIFLGPTTPTTELPSTGPVVMSMAVLLVYCLVIWTWHARAGFTPGKRLLGLRTVAVSTGRPPGFARTGARVVLFLLGGVACGMGWLAAVATFFSDSAGRRTWYDRMCGVVLVDVRHGVDPTSLRDRVVSIPLGTAAEPAEPEQLVPGIPDEPVLAEIPYEPPLPPLSRERMEAPTTELRPEDVRAAAAWTEPVDSEGLTEEIDLSALTGASPSVPPARPASRFDRGPRVAAGPADRRTPARGEESLDGRAVVTRGEESLDGRAVVTRGEDSLDGRTVAPDEEEPLDERTVARRPVSDGVPSGPRAAPFEPEVDRPLAGATSGTSDGAGTAADRGPVRAAEESPTRESHVGGTAVRTPADAMPTQVVETFLGRSAEEPSGRDAATSRPVEDVATTTAEDAATPGAEDVGTVGVASTDAQDLAERPVPDRTAGTTLEASVPEDRTPEERAEGPVLEEASQESAAEEPLPEERAEGPVLEEAPQESAAEEPLPEERAEGPVLEEASQESVAEEPLTPEEEPASPEPVTQEPAPAQEPAAAAPAAQEPAPAVPAVEEPPPASPSAEESTPAEKPTSVEPSAEEPASDGPVTEGPSPTGSADEPSVEGRATEQPAEETLPEDPAAERPAPESAPEEEKSEDRVGGSTTEGAAAEPLPQDRSAAEAASPEPPSETPALDPVTEDRAAQEAAAEPVSPAPGVGRAPEDGAPEGSVEESEAGAPDTGTPAGRPAAGTAPSEATAGRGEPAGGPSDRRSGPAPRDAAASGSRRVPVKQAPVRRLSPSGTRPPVPRPPGVGTRENPPVILPRPPVPRPDSEDVATRARGSATAPPAGRPPKGRPYRVLVTDTGERITLLGHGLLGRNPSPSPRENLDMCRAVRDPGKSLSKNHLEFWVTGEGLFVADRGSRNGSALLRGRNVSPLDQGVRTRVRDGDRLRMGERVFEVRRR